MRHLTLACALWMLSTAVLAAPTTQRCGWFVNPTPANAWHVAKNGRWIVATQGGHQADGDWPTFSAARWVATNGHYGHGCACLRVELNAARSHVDRIVHARSRPLAACRKDLRRLEPKD